MNNAKWRYAERNEPTTPLMYVHMEQNVNGEEMLETQSFTMLGIFVCLTKFTILSVFESYVKDGVVSTAACCI